MPQAEGPEQIPEQHHHRKNGTQLDDHPEHGHEFLFAGVELYDLFHQDHVACGRDGQPLGDALHNAHQDRFQYFKKHGFSSLQSGAQALLHTFRLGSFSSISYSESLRTKKSQILYRSTVCFFCIYLPRENMLYWTQTFFPVFPSDTDCRAR